MQGRFSGRLATKAAEAALVEECRLLAPLLGGWEGDSGVDPGSRNTLSTIVRAIAAGEIREYLHKQQLHSQVLRFTLDEAHCALSIACRACCRTWSLCCKQQKAAS